MHHKTIIQTEDSKANDASVIIQTSISSSTLFTHPLSLQNCQSTRNNINSNIILENKIDDYDENEDDDQIIDNDNSSSQTTRNCPPSTKTKLLNDYRDPQLELLLSKLKTKQTEISQHRQQNLQQLESLKAQLKQLKNDADELNKQQKSSIQQHQRNK